jgi:hypothetical protein
MSVIFREIIALCICQNQINYRRGENRVIIGPILYATKQELANLGITVDIFSPSKWYVTYST